MFPKMIKISRIYTRENPKTSKKFPHFFFPKKKTKKMKIPGTCKLQQLAWLPEGFPTNRKQTYVDDTDLIKHSSSSSSSSSFYHRRRLPPRRRALCSYFPRLCLLLVNLPPFSLLSLFCDFLFCCQSEICNCIILSHFLLLAGKFEPNSWRNRVVVCLDSL